MGEIMVKKQEKSTLNKIKEKISGIEEMTVIVPILVLMIVMVVIGRADFCGISNIRALFVQIPYYAIPAMGMMLIVMTGNSDVSIGKIGGLGATIMAYLLCDCGVHWAVALLVALLIGLVCGIVNAYLVEVQKVPPFVATLGMWFVAGGVRYLVIKGYQFVLSDLNDNWLNTKFIPFFKQTPKAMPFQFWCMLILLVIMQIFIKKTRTGRQWLACGDNPEVAALAGINVKKVKMMAYIIAPLFSVLSAAIYMYDSGIGNPEIGNNWEFKTVAGCVIGGCSMVGGKCSPLGVVLGIAFIYMAENAIIFAGAPSTLRVSIQGILMLFALVYDSYVQSRKVKPE